MLIDIVKVTNSLQNKLYINQTLIGNLSLNLSKCFLSNLADYEKDANFDWYCFNTTKSDVAEIIAQFRPNTDYLLRALLDEVDIFTLLTYLRNSQDLSKETNYRIKSIIHDLIKNSFKNWVINRIYNKELEYLEKEKNL